MQIKVIEVRIKKQILTCANLSCTGNYEFTGEIHILNSTDELAPGVHTFAHKCTVCSDVQNFDQKFPSLIYEDLPNG